MQYNCVDQYIAAEKARFYNDKACLKSIMGESIPTRMRLWFNRVKCNRRRCLDREWLEELLNVLHRANMAKFGENSGLMKRLFETKGKLLVEANPTSSDFGIGMPSTHIDAGKKSKWLGANWYGYSLTETREELLKTNGSDPSYAVTWTRESLVDNPRAKITYRDRAVQNFHPSMTTKKRSRQIPAKKAKRSSRSGTRTSRKVMCKPLGKNDDYDDAYDDVDDDDDDDDDDEEDFIQRCYDEYRADFGKTKRRRRKPPTRPAFQRAKQRVKNILDDQDNEDLHTMSA